MKKSLFLFAVLITLLFISCSGKKSNPADKDTQVDDETYIDSDVQDVQDVTNDDLSDDIVSEEESDNDALTIDDKDDPEPIDEDEIEDNTQTDEDFIQETEVIFVKHDASGSNNGTSWNNAFTGLQSALDAATEGTQIWVAYGTYQPTSVHELVTMDDVSDEDKFNRYKHFRMKNGVGIYGGFAGTETKLSERDVEAEETILSCDLGEVDEQYDNCFHIFYHPSGLDLDETAVLDGFSMMGGAADDVDPHTAGGAMYNDGSSPTIINGWFYWNYSFNGSVFFNKDSSIKISNSQFVNNDAPYSKGGAIYNENSNVEISDCSFTNSWAEGDNESNGGAIYSTGGKTTITDSTFKNNKADSGGAIYIVSGNAEISGCTFDTNNAEFGAGIHFNNSADSIISKCEFQYNDTYSYGESDGKGGAVRMVNSGVKIIDSLFYKHISGDGGAVYSSATASNTSTLTIINSAFSINKMIDRGGALYLDKTEASITNSVFFKNYFGYTSTGTYGGAIYRTDSGSLTVTNSIFKANTAGNGKHIYDQGSNATVTYSCIVDTSVYPGTGNINDEPLIVEPEYTPLNFGLQAESPCIDTGSNTPFEAGGFADDVTKDMDGNDRIIKGKETSSSAIIDMGAVEFKP